jgi:hypothetical protein
MYAIADQNEIFKMSVKVSSAPILQNFYGMVWGNLMQKTGVNPNFETAN